MGFRGGHARSSVEFSVMEEERRGMDYRNHQIYNLKENDIMADGKSFEIPKALVWRSYKTVSANKGAAGYDGQTIKEFNEKRDKNLYKIWNRLSSGSYQAPPVLEKRIPKAGGKERILGIPTVSDRVAQGAVKIFVEERLDSLFHEDSYGYRPNKSAHQALETCSKRCWRNSWVLKIDIKSFFDMVDHDLIIKALEHHKMPTWVILYCKRWLRAPLIAASEEAMGAERKVGTPQGGVISPLLANLFLHYAFDVWMERKFHQTNFERYADDIVCHTNTLKEAQHLKNEITARFKEVGLEVNESKSCIAYVDTFKRHNVKKELTFLGYDFKLRVLKDSRSGKLFRKCMPGASKSAMKKMTKEVRSWRIHRSTSNDVQKIADRINYIIRGWINYYGKFWYRNFGYHLWRILQSRLIKWMKARHRISTKSSRHRLRLLQKEKPKLFVHWYLLRTN